jgi:hypothetical protein
VSNRSIQNTYRLVTFSRPYNFALDHSVVGIILSVVARVRGMNLRPCRPPRATTRRVFKTREIEIHHMEERNEWSISYIEHSGVTSILSVVARVRGMNLLVFQVLPPTEGNNSAGFQNRGN